MLPWAKPFFPFARTGVNGLDLTFKHMPLLNRLVDTERRLLGATVEMADAGELADMGITNAREPMNAKQLSVADMSSSWDWCCYDVSGWSPLW